MKKRTKLKPITPRMLKLGEEYWQAWDAWEAAWNAYVQLEQFTPEWKTALDKMLTARRLCWKLNKELWGRCSWHSGTRLEVKRLTRIRKQEGDAYDGDLYMSKTVQASAQAGGGKQT